MKDELFAELLGSIDEAVEHSRGKRSLKTTTLPLPPEPMRAAEVRRVRAGMCASQAVFARYLNVSTKLVQAWEASRREPSGPALVLLHIAARQPALIEKVTTRTTNRAGSRRPAPVIGKRHTGRRPSAARRAG